MSKPNALALGCRHHLIVLYHINWICPARSPCLTTVCYIKRLLIPLIWYYNVSLVKTRLRASRRGELPSPAGFRQPNPYENVRIFLECAIYQTHVIIDFRQRQRPGVISLTFPTALFFCLVGSQRTSDHLSSVGGSPSLADSLGLSFYGFPVHNDRFQNWI